MKEATNRSWIPEEELPSVDIENLLKDKGYNSDQIHNLMRNDILFLSTQASNENHELLTLDTVQMKKILAKELEGLQIDFPLDQNREHRYLELLHAEIYIGLIVFLSITAWEISKGVISNWLYDRFRGMKKGGKTLHARVEIQITDQKQGRTYHFKYSGPADEVSKIIKETEFK